MNKNIETEFLFLDVVGPIIHQVMQTNYHTPLKRAFQFVWTTWCVIWSITSKNRHSMLKCATSAKKIHGNCWWTNRSTERQRDSSKVIFSPFFEVGGDEKILWEKYPGRVEDHLTKDKGHILPFELYIWSLLENQLESMGDRNGKL